LYIGGVNNLRNKLFLPDFGFTAHEGG